MEDRFEIFTTRVASISRNIRKIKTEEMREFDLKSPHVSCLYYLYKKNGTLTATQLCDICEEDKAAISRSIDYLEKNDYLYCESKTEKKYNCPIVLTEKGLKVAKILVDKVDKVLSLASIGLSEEDRAVFYKALILISDNLKSLTNEYKS